MSTKLGKHLTSAEAAPLALANGSFRKTDAAYEDGNLDEDGLPLPSDTGIAEHKKLGVWGFCAVGFFWVCGGIFGNEALMQTGPPGLVFLALLIVPIVYSLPVSLLCAELSTAIPEDGGMIVWTTRAFGRLVGQHNAYWVWVCWCVDSSIYPVFAAEYIDTALGNTDPALKRVGAIAIVLLVTLVKLAGMDAIVRFTTLLTCFAILPGALFVLIGLKDLDFSVITSFEGDINWQSLFSWMLWLYSGFFNLGSLAGEIRGKSTFSISIVILMIMTQLINVPPLLVAISLDPDRDNYEPGYFATLATQLSGEWLAWLFTVGSVMSMIGLFNSQIITAEVTFSYLVDTLFPEFAKRREEASEMAAAEAGRVSCSWPTRTSIMIWLWNTRNGGAARIYQLLHMCIALVLIWLPYDLLVEMSILVYAVSALLFLASFLTLRVREPNMVRPFRVWGGLPGAVAIVLIPAMLTLCNMFFELTSTEPVLGIKFLRLIILGSIIGFGLLVHLCAWLWTNGSAWFVEWNFRRQYKSI